MKNFKKLEHVIVINIHDNVNQLVDNKISCKEKENRIQSMDAICHGKSDQFKDANHQHRIQTMILHFDVKSDDG